MKISLENEIRLKNLLRQKDKENECKTLSLEIENKEKNMLKHITKDYMNIINRCNDLKLVHNKIPNLLDENQNLVINFKENLFCIEEVEQEIFEHKNLDKKIEDLLNELSMFKEFYELISREYKSDKFYFYNLTQNLKKIKELIINFQKYRFYEEINEIFLNYLKKVEDENIKFIEEYKNIINEKSIEFGKNIIDQITYCKNNPKIIFNEIYSLRDKFITSNFLDIFYMNGQLDLLDNFIDKFNFERKIIISSFNKNSDIMYRFTSEILNSYFLIRINKNILNYYDFILENINEYFISTNIEEMYKSKDILISIKYLMNLLNIEDDNLYETIGRISIEYFAKNNIENSDREKFKLEMKNFIEKSYKFIDKLNNNEINEIFVNKVDLYLKDFISTSDTKNIINDEKFLKEIIKSINKKFPDLKFRSEEFFKLKIEEIKYKIVSSKMEEIENLFNEPNKDFSINLQNYVTKNNEIRKELYGVIKIKFIEMVNDSKDKNIDYKRIVACKVTCFHKYLYDTDSHLFDDFRLVNDEANKF